MKSSPSDSRDAVSVRNQRSGIGCVIAFCSLFILIGLVTFTFTFALPVARTLQAQNWVATPCTINSGKISSVSGDSTTYRYDLDFSYQVDGQTYASSRRSFFPKSSGSYGGAIADSKRWPVGTNTTCYVNPANPREAVLNKGLDRFMWFGLIPLAFVAFGGLFLVLVLKSMRGEKTPRSKWRPPEAAAGANTTSHRAPMAPTTTFRSYSGMEPATSASPFQDITALTPGPGKPQESASVAPRSSSLPNASRVLAPEGGPPAARAGCMFAFALFWNGFTLFMIFQFVGSMSGGLFSILPALFFIPFLLIGIFLACAAFGGVLGLLNPRPIVTLGEGILRPGGSIDVSWQLQGGFKLPSTLSVTLEGREEATYRRGTDTYTDKAVFFREVLQDGAQNAAGRANIATGQVRISIPENLMHSFESPNNKILYVVRLHGPYPRWPDLKEEFRIVVEPGLPRTGGAVINRS